MELLETLSDIDSDNQFDLNYRESSRAILFDEKKLVPILFVSKYNYYKLPGGGADKGEDKIKALARECIEEIGSEIEILGEVGKVIELRLGHNLKQISYCYYGQVISKGNPNFTEKEISQGFEVLWTTLDDAILKIQSGISNDYITSFICKRDLIFLRKFKEMRK